MTVMTHNFIFHDTEGLTESAGLSGAPAIVTDPVKYGSHACQMDNADWYYIDHREAGESSQGNYEAWEFHINFQDKVPTSDTSRVFWIGGTTQFDIGIYIDLTSDLRVYDSSSGLIATVTDPFTVGTWYRIRILAERVDSTGIVKLWINDSLEVDLTSQNLSGDATDLCYFMCNNTNLQFTWDGFYYQTGAALDGSDFIDDPVYLGGYQNDAEDDTDQGSALDAGTWADASELPFTDGNYARYSTGGAAGHTRTDEGTRLGPGAYSGTPKSAKWLFRAQKPAAVAGTVHQLRMGKYVAADTYTDQTITPTTAWAEYIYCWDPVTRAWTPDSGNEFVAGMTIDSGGESFDIAELFCQLLVDAPAGGVFGGVARGVGRGVMEGVG